MVKSFKEALAIRDRLEESLRNTFNFYGLNFTIGLNNLIKKLINFRLVALGDSVMWGQGLLDAEKTFNILAEAIKELYPNLNLRVENFSHSGAIIGSVEQRNTLSSNTWGEIPANLPTILSQVDISSQEIDYYTDLVLVNGGLNDINFRTIVSPFGGDLDLLCKENCFNKVKNLLLAIHQKYPNATILLTGYYKIFSKESNKALIPLFLLAIGLGDIIVNFIIQEIIIDRCVSFFNLSEEYFKKAVNETSSVIKHKATYISNTWDDSNSIFTSNPFPFGINADLSPQDNPEIIKRRQIECPDLQCTRASAGHPNINGAKRNAEQLIEFIKMQNLI